jgi:predicted transcriptional regulator of viral defense system
MIEVPGDEGGRSLRAPLTNRGARLCVMLLLSNIQQMHDTNHQRPDHERLFQIASEQHGHFTASQAARCGFGSDLLHHLTRSGRFIRVGRGVYRFRDYPSSSRDELAAAWLGAGKEAVVSHESALDLLELGDVIPSTIHLTVPRSRRYVHRRPGVTVHTTMRPLGSRDVITRDGLRVTSPARTILDAAESGTAPEQIESAVRRAVSTGVLDEDRLRRMARERGGRVERLVIRSLTPTR